MSDQPNKKETEIDGNVVGSPVGGGIVNNDNIAGCDGELQPFHV